MNFLLISLFLSISLVHCQVPLIIDTDASFDVDDVIAICMAHVLMDRGEVDIKGIVHNAGYPEAIGAVSVLNTYYGREDIPLGAYKGDYGRDPWGGDWVRGWYVEDLVDNFPSPVKDSSQVPTAVETYRKLLAETEGKTMVISSIGFVTNLADLLRSEPDEFSDMNGYDLIDAKVKTIVWQGGHYPPIHGFGDQTYNFDCGEGFYDISGCRGESAYAVNNMPDSVEMIYSDIGDEVYTGGVLSTCAGDDNPCRKAIIDQQGYGNPRSSWDGIVTLQAIRGDAGMEGWSRYSDGGKARVEEWGANNWEAGDGSLQSYLVLDGAWEGDWDTINYSRQRIGNIIDDIICSGAGGTTPKPLQGGPIVNPNTGLCLSAQVSFPGDYTNVIADTCRDGDKAQQWFINSNGQIQHAQSTKCLDDDANNSDSVQVFSCFDAEWQKWDINGNAIVNRNTGKCLDIFACVDGCEAGTDVWDYDCAGTPNQEWDVSQAGTI